jgi:hypothetical protein
MANKQFYYQRTKISDQYIHSGRLNLLIPLVKNKKVLHIGFVDWPITDVNSSLHLTLSEHCERIDGFDVNIKDAENLRVANGDIFYSWDDVPDDYDVILIPEVIEHVDNVSLFLKQVSSKKGMLIITAPDAFLLQKRTEYINGEFVEIVHPDHNCYYTPFTLKNCIEKYTDRKVKELYWIQSQSVAAICE